MTTPLQGTSQKVAKYSVSVGLMILMAAMTPAHAQTPPLTECQGAPILNLSASSADEVANDRVRLNWTVQFEKPNAAEAMTEVNKVLSSSITRLEKNNQIKGLRNAVQTYPLYGRDGQPKNWVAQGTLTFELPVEALKSKGSVDLEAPLTLANLQYFVSPQRIEEHRERLSKQAIADFMNKASSASAAFGFPGFSVNQVGLQDERLGPAISSPMQPRMLMKASQAIEVSSTDVATAAGNSNLSVSVNGSVCMKK